MKYDWKPMAGLAGVCFNGGGSILFRVCYYKREYAG